MQVISFFKSVKLAIALILILAATSIVGTVFTQDLPPHHGIAKFGETGYRVLQFLGVFDLYHSGWFRLLIILLALNILVCSIARIQRTYRLVTWKGGEDSEGIPSGLPLRRRVVLDGSPEEIWPRLMDRLSSVGLRVMPGEGKDLRADRGRVGRWGPEFSHLGFLVIIVGMVIGSLTGFRGNMDLVEGETDNRVFLRSGEVVDLSFDVRCEDFEVTFYEGSRRPKEYTSLLTVLENGRELFRKQIEVNDPLRHRGHWLYQSTYGTIGPAPDSAWVELLIEPQEAYVRLELGERKRIEGTSEEIEFLRFEPDFVMASGGEVTSRSDQLRNQAAQVRIYRDGEPAIERWIFAQFPNVHPTEEVPHTFTLVAHATREYTGLQVAYDPGVPVVWTGCGLLILGLFLSFTIPHRRVWARMEAGGAGCVLRIAVGARGGLKRFGETIEEVVEGLSRKTGKERVRS